MRKVYLRLKEMNEYKHVKNYVEHGGRIAAPALKLGCSERTVWRKVAGYKAHGKAFFVHGNRDCKPITSICEQDRKTIIHLYTTPYDDANFQHFHELLTRYHQQDVAPISLSCLRNIMKRADILSPRAHRKTKREYNKRHKNNQNVTHESLEVPEDTRIPSEASPTSSARKISLLW